MVICAPDGPKLCDERDATDLIGTAFGHQAEWVVVPVERLSDDFFTLSTRLAGLVIQKFVNYRMRLVVVGDISARLADSATLRDFVRETNRGRQVWFVTDLAELDARLASSTRLGEPQG